MDLNRMRRDLKVSIIILVLTTVVLLLGIIFLVPNRIDWNSFVIGGGMVLIVTLVGCFLFALRETDGIAGIIIDPDRVESDRFFSITRCVPLSEKEFLIQIENEDVKLKLFIVSKKNPGTASYVKVDSGELTFGMRAMEE